MPRRIPGTQIALVYLLRNNLCSKSFTKIDMWEVDLAFLRIKCLRDKRKSRKG